MMQFHQKKKFSNQLGQTLVETMVASMVLVVGIGASVSLAIYGLSVTTSVSKQLIAVGLAREAMEAVKNMRDTNWLRGTLSNSCHNFYTNTEDANCFQDWLNSTYNIDPGGTSSNTYYLGFNANSSTEYNFWQLGATGSRFGLNYTPNNPEIGFYSAPAGGLPVTSGTSGYARKITLTKESSPAAFAESEYPRLLVTVDVWWRDKRCPDFTATVPVTSGCKVTLATYLTNWKDY